MFKDIFFKYGYEVRCLTFNKFNRISWNPERALAAYSAFYEINKPNENPPPWIFLTSPDLIERYSKIFVTDS